MQYVRAVSGSVSKTWNSINPATLSGAIDVIVVEHHDGTLGCSPFHVRFGKFSLLRPYEKKVEFKVNNVKQDYPMKLAEGGEAFFVFETTNSIPEALQTSPLVSPVTSPDLRGGPASAPALAEPDPFELEALSDSSTADTPKEQQSQPENGIPIPHPNRRTHSDKGQGQLAPLSSSLDANSTQAIAGDWSDDQTISSHRHRANTDHALLAAPPHLSKSLEVVDPFPKMNKRPPSPLRTRTDRSTSPPPLTSDEAMTRAINLSKKLWGSNIPSQVTDRGDLMLDMTGYKTTDDEALRAEVIARKILSEELEGNYDIGSLIGADDKGNLWIYSSEEAKEEANRRLTTDGLHALQPLGNQSTDALSDPGYHSDDARSETSTEYAGTHHRHGSDSAIGLSSNPASPDAQSAGDPNRNYAKTLRLTSDQLKSLYLKPGQNTMSFSVNRATCTANIWLWQHDVPIVISDIDGTITKSDALGHVLNMIGRDWTHLGVAKLYTDIAANGYNLLYLTSRSIGLADTTRAYMAGVVQEGGYKLPKGPVIMSPDRTIAALRREIYLRKPEVFKMACLRDVMALFSGSDPRAGKMIIGDYEGGGRGKNGSPFYAGFGNRLTDALSYRSVNIPSTRIFTINSNSEVSLDLLSLNTYKTGYSSMREIVDHFFPPVGLLVKGGGEEFTDFNYWRDRPLELDDFSGSESGDDEEDEDDDEDEDEDDDDDEDGLGPALTRQQTTNTLSEDEGEMGGSYLSERRRSVDNDPLDASILESVDGDPNEDELAAELGQEDLPGFINDLSPQEADAIPQDTTTWGKLDGETDPLADMKNMASVLKESRARELESTKS